MARKMHGRASFAVTEKGKEREGYDRTVSNKDMAELDRDRTGKQEVAQGLVIKPEHRYRASAKSWLT